MKVIKREHVKQAIEIAKAGGRDGIGYNQLKWCGASCCLLGWARIVAGSDSYDGGVRDGELEDTPFMKTAENLFQAGSPDVLNIMENVGEDGKIYLRNENLIAELQNVEGVNYGCTNLENVKF